MRPAGGTPPPNRPAAGGGPPPAGGCGAARRSSPGRTNLGSPKTDGWDVDLFWTLPQTSIGQFKLAWKNTFVGRYEATGAAGQKQPQKPGVEVADSSIPEWTSNASLGWTMD